MGIGRAAGMVGMPEWVGSWVRAVQELRRLGRAGSAWLEAIRPDQVRHCGGELRSEHWVHAVGRDGSAACIVLMPLPAPSLLDIVINLVIAMPVA
jgi:hypothetical protein